MTKLEIFEIVKEYEKDKENKKQQEIKKRYEEIEKFKKEFEKNCPGIILFNGQWGVKK